jgi:hypothetical protein
LSDQDPEEDAKNQYEITDPYLASAIEFMYSEDTEEDFNTMDREKQEALLKKTWMDRERQFYGEEVDDDEVLMKKMNFSIKEQPENEEDDEEQDSDSGDDLDRGGANYTIRNLEQAISMDDEEDTEHTDQVTSSQEVQSRYQIMKFKHLESKLESKK